MTLFPSSKVIPPISLCSLTTHDIVSLAVAVGTPIFLGYLVSCHVHKFRVLYHRDVIKPPYMPPDWLFSPIWTLMYVVMGYASFLIYYTGYVYNVSTVRHLICYVMQLGVNLCWPCLFFRYRIIKASLYAITANFILALVTAYKFNQVNPEAAELFGVYLGWLMVMAYINKIIWQINVSNVALMKEGLFTYPSDEMVAKANLQLAIERCSLVELKKR